MCNQLLIKQLTPKLLVLKGLPSWLTGVERKYKFCVSGLSIRFRSKSRCMIKHTYRQKFGIVRLGEKGKYPTFGFDSVVVRRSKTLVVKLPPVELSHLI